MEGRKWYSEEDGIHMGYTIERQLKAYAKAEDTTGRHQILWHVWNQNKGWLTQMLEWTMSSFQTYSYHNASHADSVINNMERLLGEERIRQLSASDCFMLLHAAYMHDVGMSISASERLAMMEDDKFIDLIERLEADGDPDMRKAAQSVLQTVYTGYEEASTRERSSNMKKLLHEKLDAYYGLGQLMAEYQRGMHAGKVKDRMQQWTLDPEKLGNSFAVSGIPLRIFLRIADCASIHAISGIDPVLELPKEDSGYALDMIHPRFVAVMLQLGDALDMDNDRFNPFCFQFAGSFPRTSALHFKKHHAIRQLNITPETIQIHADCDSQEALRLVRMECEGLEEILKNAGYHWADIAPAGMSGCLPTLNQNKILLEGQRVPGELVKAQFNISQVRAFRLLEGANVYEGNYVFIREIIQNAIDASKMQCWEDYIYRCKLKERKILQDDLEITKSGLKASEKEILSEVDVWDYPIEVYFELGVRVQNEKEETVFIPIEEVVELQKIEREYGVRVTIRDHGTGISKDDLIKISDVGSSYEEKKHFINKMPDWLKPTGQFGIGLQSVFLVADSIMARTYTRSGEKYEITFNKVSKAGGGYINVKPLPQDEYLIFGTSFEIFINYKYKLPHAEFWKAWNTESDDADRFIDEYDKMRPVRHSQEMLNQMVMYIDDMLGENLFPIYVRIKGKNFDARQYEFLAKNVRRIVLETDTIKASSRAEQEKNISWLFKAIKSEGGRNKEENDDTSLIIVDIKDGIGALDCEQSKLYIWNNELGVFARFGGSRMLSSYTAASSLWENDIQDKRKTRIYLKGIFVQSHSMYRDSELLELIDIKGGKIGKAHIAINRNEFTREGIDYLEQTIYPALISSAKAILVELNERENRNEEKGLRFTPFYLRIIDSIIDKTYRCEDAVGNVEAFKLDLEETVLSAVGLSYFLRVLGREKAVFCEKQGREERCRWDLLLNEIVALRKKPLLSLKKEGRGEPIKLCDIFNKYINAGMMHEMRVFFYDEVNRTGFEGTTKKMDYASLLVERRKIAIISIRHNEHSKWFHVPMVICELEEDEKDVEGTAYEMFVKKSRTRQEEMDTLQKLEEWADGIFVWLKGIMEIQRLHEEYGVDSDIQYTLNYMLGNVPTVALYANESGDVRINVLAAEWNGSIFYNRNMKRLILKKVDKLYMQYHAKRFVTNVWRGYECIALKSVPSSVCVAKGAFLAKHQTNEMLLPVLGENVQKLLNLRQQDFFKEIIGQEEHCKQLEEVCDKLIGIYPKFESVICMGNESEGIEDELKGYLSEEKIVNLEEIDYVRGKNLAGSYWQQMLEFLKAEKERFIEQRPVEKGQNQEQMVSFEDLLEGKPEEQKFQRVLVTKFFKSRGSSQEMPKDLPEKEVEEIWEWFQQAICFIDRYRSVNMQKLVASHPKVEEFKRRLWGKEDGNNLETVQRNLIEYVMKHTAEKLTEKQVRSCYERLLDDMLECILDKEQKDKKRRSVIEALF